MYAEKEGTARNGKTTLTAQQGGSESNSVKANHPTIEIVTMGETMGLVVLPVHEESGQASDCVVSFGGAESNVSIGLARLGISVAWVSALGADFFGEFISRSVAAEGVVVRATVKDDLRTGTMLKTAKTEGARKVRYFRRHSAASTLSFTDVPESLISSARILHLTGILPALSSTAQGAAVRAIEVAKKHGCLVSFDINYRDALWSASEASDFIHSVLADIDILFGGEDELRLLRRDLDMHSLVDVLTTCGPKEIVVKQGAAGARTFANGKWFEQRALQTEVLDTVGAGDAFVAGYLYELLRGSDVSERLETAVVTGGLATSHLGDWEGFPCMDVLQQKKKEVK